MEHTPRPWKLGHPRMECTIKHNEHGGGHGTKACIHEHSGWYNHGSPFQIYQDKQYKTRHRPSFDLEGCIVGYTDYEEAGVVSEADARLMAAAPDLLAIITSYLISENGHFYDCIPGTRGEPLHEEHCSQVCREMRAAITKALGVPHA